MSTAETGLNGENTTGSSFDVYKAGGTTDALQLTIKLILCTRRWRSMMDENLRAIGQSAARFEALAAIMNSPSPTAQVDIARRLRIEGPTVTRMLDSLERDQLVQRSPDPQDRRTKQLRVTEDGEEALSQIFAITDAMRHKLLDGIDEEEIRTVTAFLDRLLSRLDAGLPDAALPDAEAGKPSS